MTRGIQMNPHQHTPSMNQKIFETGLSVEAISAYLICCSLADADAPISTNNLMGLWNSADTALIECLEVLEKKNIIRRIISGSEGSEVYLLTDIDKWELD